MPTVEAGLFIFIVVLAGIFTFGSFRAVGNVKGVLHIVAVALFMVVSIYMVSGHEVAATTVEETALMNGTQPYLFATNSTTVFIAGGEESAWFGYVFLGLAGLNLILFVKDVWKAE